MGRTISEKILARACGRDQVAVGEIVWPMADLVVVPDMGFVGLIDQLRRQGVARPIRPDKVLVSCDHDVPVVNQGLAARANKTKELAAELGVKYDPTRPGIGHYVPAQEGLAGPGTMIFSCDTYSGTLGAVGAFAPCITQDIVTVLAMDTVWLRVPGTVRVNFRGALRSGVMARDVAQFVCTDIGEDRANYRVIEYGGSAVRDLSMDARFTLCNFPVAVGAKTAIVNPDEVTMSYVREHGDRTFTPVLSDDDAEYAIVFEYDLSSMEPQISVPPDTANVQPLSKHLGKRIDSGFIGSCASGNIDDLRAAARVLAGRHVHPDVRLYVSPATQRFFVQAAREGLLEQLAAAGAYVMGPSCQVCAGIAVQTVDGEVRISTSTRNERGRMGSFEADIYLGSAVTVAASAIKGAIADPREFL